MKRAYYTLLTRQEECDPWEIAFGDFSLRVVREEYQEYRDNGYVHSNLHIIQTHSDDQREIDRAVALHN